MIFRHPHHGNRNSIGQHKADMKYGHFVYTIGVRYRNEAFVVYAKRVNNPLAYYAARSARIP